MAVESKRKNSRRHPRHDVDLPGLVKPAHRMDHAKNLQVQNISAEGACLKLSEFSPSPGDIVALHIHPTEPSDPHPLLAFAEVCWVAPDGLFGVKFLDVDSFSKNRLKRILERAVVLSNDPRDAEPKARGDRKAGRGR